MRIDILGHPENFAACLRTHHSDKSTGRGFCGIAFSIRKVWIGDANLTSVVGTVILGLNELLEKISTIENLDLFSKNHKEAKEILFEPSDLPPNIVKTNFHNYQCTDIAFKHNFSISCECFDGFYIFAATSKDKLKIFLIDLENPNCSFDHVVGKHEIEDILIAAKGILA